MTQTELAQKNLNKIAMDKNEELQASMVDHSQTPDQGSFLVGFLLGYLLQPVGVIVAFMLKKPRTTFGLVVGLVVSFLVVTICAIAVVDWMIKIYGGISIYIEAYWLF